MSRLRTVGLAGVLVLAVAGCGALGGGGHKGSSSSAPDPNSVIDAMQDDVTAALKAALPGSGVSKPDYGGFDCKASMWTDTNGSGMVVRSASVTASGPETDTRSASELVSVMVQALIARGWAIRTDLTPIAPAKAMAKPGVAGSVHIGASRPKSASGKTFPMVSAGMYSDCLPNPDPAKR